MNEAIRVSRAGLLDLFAQFARDLPNFHGRAKCDSRKGYPPDLWTSKYTEDRREARRICRACPVREECEEWAITHPDLADPYRHTNPREAGAIYGGLSAYQRATIRAQREQQQDAA